MEITLAEVFGLASIPVIVGLVEAAKRALNLPKRLAPVAAIALGMLWNVALASSLGEDLRVAAILGVLAGMGAVSLYSGVRATILGR